MKKTFFILNILLAFTMTAVEIGDAVLARVNDKIITAFDVRSEARLRESALPPALTQLQRMEAIAKIRAEVLDEMIVTELVWHDFTELKGKVPQNIVQERIDRIIRSTANSDEERFRDMLHEQNSTYQEFEDNIRKQIGVEMLLYDRTRRNIFITNAQVQKYFEEHSKDYVKASKYHIQAIMLQKDDATQETISALRTALAQGTDFAEVAKKYSQGANAENGGDLGWMDSVAPELENCLATLKKGEISATELEIGSGLYIVKLLDKQVGGNAELTSELKMDIKKILEDIEAQKRRDEYLKTLYMKYPVRKY